MMQFSASKSGTASAKKKMERCLKEAKTEVEEAELLWNELINGSTAQHQQGIRYDIVIYFNKVNYQFFSF